MAAAKTTAAELEKTLRMMDVADQIRRTRQRIEEHLEENDRETIREQLLERYRAMGHEADPALLDAAIDTVLAQQNRFRPATPGLGTWLAHRYVDRRRIARRVGVPLVILAILIAVVFAARTGVREMREGRAERAAARIERLSTGAATLLERVRDVAEDPEAVRMAEGYHAEVATAAASGDRARADAARDKLRDLLDRLEQEYSLVIVRGRERDNVRHYLIVQAIADGGRRLTVPIRNEENGAIERVNEWGERVEREIYERVGRDYADDNVIDDNVFGRKRRGYLEPERRFPSAGQITRW